MNLWLKTRKLFRFKANDMIIKRGAALSLKKNSLAESYLKNKTLI